MNRGGGNFRKETIYKRPHCNWGSVGIRLVDLNGRRPHGRVDGQRGPGGIQSDHPPLPRAKLAGKQGHISLPSLGIDLPTCPGAVRSCRPTWTATAAWTSSPVPSFRRSTRRGRGPASWTASHGSGKRRPDSSVATLGEGHSVSPGGRCGQTSTATVTLTLSWGTSACFRRRMERRLPALRFWRTFRSPASRAGTLDWRPQRRSGRARRIST